MNTDVYTPLRPAVPLAHLPPAEGEERFAERRRIVLMEPDPALRSVLVRTLCRLGCIVSLKREPERVVESLGDSLTDGVVVALDADLRWAASLQSANRRQVPVVVLTYALPAPGEAQKLATVHFLRKPFDVGELFTHLHLPDKAQMVRGR
ncbi:MAG: hypothetical protein HY259_11060 [Chloroflexi bacterium]|nr:hypothetical protein [Chloroflexota bacterium]